MINATRLQLLHTTEIPAYVYESEAYVKRHRNWIFDSPDKKSLRVARAKSVMPSPQPFSSFTSSFDTSLGSDASGDLLKGLPAHSLPQPLTGSSYPALATREGASG